MSEKIYISELCEDYSGKVVIQQFFSSKDLAIACCRDLQNLEKYGYNVLLVEDKV